MTFLGQVRWLQISIINGSDWMWFTIGASKVTIFIDGEKKLVVKDHGGASFYFKCGVYAAPSGSSHYMESRW